MSKVCTNITEMIGDSPFVQIPTRNADWELYLKMEKTNPGQSMKDRMALSMITRAEKRGILKPGGTIIESSSGNTAIGLALIAAQRGYKFIAVVDHHAAPEKIDIIRAYGAEVVFVGDGYAADHVAVKEREEMAAKLNNEIPDSVFLNQADNPDNPEGYRPLAQEIVSTIVGVRAIIGAIGTGGSLCGTARAIKELNRNIEVIAVEPEGSVIFDGPAGPYFQSGTGNPGNVELADNVDKSLIDKNYFVSDKGAFNTARFLAKQHGILIGGSAGGVVYQALEDLSQKTGKGAMVAIIPDGGERYVSTIFNDTWMLENKLFDPSIEARLKILMNAQYEL